MADNWPKTAKRARAPCLFCDPGALASFTLDACDNERAKEMAKIAKTRCYAASWHRGREPGRARLAGAAAKLSFENPAETGNICEAEILGNRRDRLGRRGVQQDGPRFEQSLALDVAGRATAVFEEAIEIDREIPTGRLKVFGAKVGVRRRRRTACRTRSLRPTSICRVASVTRCADGATAAATMIPTASVSQGRSASITVGNRRSKEIMWSPSRCPRGVSRVDPRAVSSTSAYPGMRYATSGTVLGRHASARARIPVQTTR